MMQKLICPHCFKEDDIDCVATESPEVVVWTCKHCRKTFNVKVTTVHSYDIQTAKQPDYRPQEEWVPIKKTIAPMADAKKPKGAINEIQT